MAAERVLLIEDDDAIARILELELQANHFDVTRVASSAAGLQEVDGAAGTYAAVVLDLGLPDRDGVDTLREMRQKTRLPVIIVTGRDHQQSVISGLAAGADDYVVKPVSPAEVSARVRAQVRRSEWMNVADRTKLHYERDGLNVDLERHIVTRDGEFVMLTRNEWRLLEAFVRNAGKVLVHEQLNRLAFGSEFEEEVEYLRVWISRLRSKLGRPGEDRNLFVEALPGVGYRLREAAPEAISAAG